MIPGQRKDKISSWLARFKRKGLFVKRIGQKKPKQLGEQKGGFCASLFLIFVDDEEISNG